MPDLFGQTGDIENGELYDGTIVHYVGPTNEEYINNKHYTVNLEEYGHEWIAIDWEDNMNESNNEI